MFFRQQDELRRLKEELTTKDVRIRQLELELNNLKNVSPNNVWPLTSDLSASWTGKAASFAPQLWPPTSFWALPPLSFIYHNFIPAALRSAHDNMIAVG